MRRVEFEPFALGGEADIFAIKYSDEKVSEVDKFLILYKDSDSLRIKNNMVSINNALERIYTMGAKESYFRIEGKMDDRI